jgi:integrase
VKTLSAPAAGNQITYDDEVKGFGVRITKAGARAFILNYRAAGRERRITIGSFPDWSVSAARERAKELKREVDNGGDPMGDRHADRAAATVDELADRFVDEHLSKRRDSTVTDYKSILRLYIRPQLGKMRVADLRHSDVEKLHRTIAAKAPYRANRAVAVLSKMLALAVKWEIRADNVARGIEKAPEERRERFLSQAEIDRLASALATHKEKVSVNAIRLLMLTGARRGETLAARWTEFDLQTGVWLKPSAHTKTKKVHRVPLSLAALALLVPMRAEADKEIKRGGAAEYVFPGAKPNEPLTEIKRVWLSLCRAAGLAVQVPKLTPAGKPSKDARGEPVMVWQSTVRIHDLRHTYASILASSGQSLPIIGALLGHSQAATTQRYAHLMDNPLRMATEHAGRVITNATRNKTAEPPADPEP